MSFKSTFDRKILTLENATQADIDAFVFPEEINELYIIGDEVESLRVPDGCNVVAIEKNTLKHIYLPDSVEWLYLEDNCLRELELPRDVMYVIAPHNYITKITFRGGEPRKLAKLDLSHNRLTELNFKVPPGLDYIDIRENTGHCHVTEEIQRAINISELD